MALEDLPFAPGFYADDTDRGAGQLGYWKDGDKVRFVNKLPQKLGGWTVGTDSAMVGIARDLLDWVSLRSEKFVAIGTTSKLYVRNGNSVYDITPIRASGTLGADPFTTTEDSDVVSVAHATHGATIGSYVTFGGATAVGGITLDGEYAITAVTDTNNYTITHSSAATSSASGGGASVTYAYQINIGAVDSVAGLGWGAGGYGEETWGTARSTTDLLFNTRVWGLDTWGEDLIACPLDGNIYVWDSSAGTSTRATLISGAPTSNKWACVSQQDRHLIALGAGGDALLVQWSDTEDYTAWTPSVTNTAGDKRLDSGSEIYCAVNVRDEKVIFTNATLYAMQFSGGVEVFSFRVLGANGGVHGPNAAVAFADRLYWAGEKNFYVYDGSISVLPCPVKDYVFTDINRDQRFKTIAAAGNAYGEIWWFYVSENATEIDRYVIYNTVEQCWYYGTLVRTAFIGDSDVFPRPYGVGADGYLYFHEDGVDAAGAAITSYLESGDAEIPPAGGEMMHVSKLVPDFKRISGTLSITVTGKKYPQASATETAGAINVTSSTPFINPRLRARQISLRLDSSAVGDDWRMGTIRIEAVPHGGR